MGSGGGGRHEGEGGRRFWGRGAQQVEGWKVMEIWKEGRCEWVREALAWLRM